MRGKNLAIVANVGGLIFVAIFEKVRHHARKMKLAIVEIFSDSEY
jgi:hypothetical protein